MRTALKLPSYADIEALLEGLTSEILAGQLIVSPRPAKPHLRTATRLGNRLGAFDDDDGAEPFDAIELPLRSPWLPKRPVPPTPTP